MEQSVWEEIVEAVLSELKERGGFDNWWDGIDYDIQDEIEDDLTQAVYLIIKRRALEAVHS